MRTVHWEMKGAGNTYILSGPSIIGERTGWALSAVGDSGSFSASWITGAAVGHPAIGSREIVSELRTGFAYGVQGTNDASSGDLRRFWQEGLLIGAQQVGDSLVLSRFHGNGIPDISTPNASINLTRVIE